MKLDDRFHCFGCGEDGDVIDFTAKLFLLTLREAAEKLIEDFGDGEFIGKLQVSGDTRYLSDDLMRLLAIIVRPTSEKAYRFLLRECLHGAEIFAPQPEYPLPEQVTILRNPHISRNEEALVTPLKNVGPIRKKYLSHLYYVAMVDSSSIIADYARPSAAARPTAT